MVTEGWKHLCSFPRRVWEPFWHILPPVLLNPTNAANKELITLFCKEQKVPPESMLAAMGCLELLLKQAAALDLPEEKFQQDLEAIAAGNAEELIQFVRDRFPNAKQGLREKIFQESLAAHGKVMIDLEWRVDKVRHSSRGKNLNAEIVLLTLHYREDRKEDKITMQLSKEAAGKLSAFCDRFIHRGKPRP